MKTLEASVVQKFYSRFHLSPKTNDYADLLQVIAAFSTIPYENLTKIIKNYHFNSHSLLRDSNEVICDYLKWGTGGTCFSLTHTLIQLVQLLGWKAEPILADRKYGQNTHSALVLWVDQTAFLIDPGYLIIQPIPLFIDQPFRFKTAFNEIILTPDSNRNQLHLSTIQNNNQTYRLSFKINDRDWNQFYQVWKSSFDWEMMRYPILTCVQQEKQIYIQSNRLQIRSHENVMRQELSLENIMNSMQKDFLIHSEIIQEAMRILKSQGELHGLT